MYTKELATPTYANYPNTYFTLNFGDKLSVNGVTLQFNAAGDVQVVNGAGQVLWHAGTSASCGTCQLVMQNDGNLVLYVNGGATWSAGTYNRGAYVTLSSVAPYFTVSDGNANIIWPSNAGASFIAAATVAARVGPNAVAAKSFLDSLAVNSHVDQNGISAPNMMTMLNYLGVKTIRDGWNTGLAATYTAMAQQGVRFDVGAGDPHAAGALSGHEAIAAMAPGALLAVEGPNEINNWSFVTNGVTSQKGWPNNAGPLVQDFMTTLLALVHADAKLPGAVVYDLTWGGTTDADKYGMLDLKGQADFGNIHFYPGGQPYAALRGSINGAYHHVLPPQAVITETGYDTANVSPRAQAILNLNLYLGAFQQGFNKTYIYELYDEWQTYGLFKDVNTPKPAATAIHNLTTLLADGGTPAQLGQLNYSLSGLPSTGHSLLLQKSNGKFELILWNEAVVYANGADVTPANVAVQVQLGASVAGVSVFDPLQGTGAIQTSARTSQLTVNLGADALILEIQP